MKITLTCFFISIILVFFKTRSDKEESISIYTQAYMITNLIAAECNYCGIEDIKYITYTIINRKNNEKFPVKVKEVIFQDNQFHSINKKINVSYLFNIETYNIVVETLQEENVPKVLFFIARTCNSQSCQIMLKNRKIVYKTKNHYYLI